MTRLQINYPLVLCKGYEEKRWKNPRKKEYILLIYKRKRNNPIPMIIKSKTMHNNR